MELRIFCVYACLMVLSLVRLSHSYFCSRFFKEIKDRTPYEFHLDDSTPVGTVIQSFAKPTNTRQALTFTSGDIRYVNIDQELFALVVSQPLYPRIGEVLKVYGTCVEYIPDISYQITMPVTMIVQVEDTNDAPVFANLPATITIPEDSATDALIYTVEVDNSFDVRPEYIETTLKIYEIRSNDTVLSDHPVKLDEGGQVYLTLPLDHESGQQEFDIHIHAQDGGSPPMSNTSVLTVLVGDVDDMGPAFTRKEGYYAEVIGEKPVSEPHCFETKPAIHAEDQDGTDKQPVKYSIVSGSPGQSEYWGQYFQLDEHTGTLCQLKTIDRMMTDPATGRLAFHNFQFTIKATQEDDPSKNDTSHLLVNVRDANEHAPTFDRNLYRASIKEYPVTKAGTRLLQVSAEDKDHGMNSQFQYLLSPDAAPGFIIDRDTGWISVNDPTVLDREQTEMFEFEVAATETHSMEEKGDLARVMITVQDINDNEPIFNQDHYNFTIKDNHLPGLPIHEDGAGVQAADADAGDNGKVVYNIGMVWRNGGPTSLADLGRFSINSKDGQLRLAGTLNDLRRRRQHPDFKLKVTATDQAHREAARKSAHVFAFIAVEEANDFPPVIQPQDEEIWVNESLPIGSVVTKLEVTDEDGDEDIYLSYDITHGNDDRVFNMFNGGRVILEHKLDRERQERHEIEIQVSDGKHVVKTTLVIRILDDNDNAPTFSRDYYEMRIQEAPVANTVLGRVTATDPDTGAAGQIEYSIRHDQLANNALRISDDGEITVKRAAASFLDRERIERLTIKVIARDKGTPSLQTTAEVTLVIGDVNDNPPVFSRESYKGTVEEAYEGPLPQIVFMNSPINATDRDADAVNRNIRYSLMGDGSDIFTIDPNTADVMVMRKNALDCEQRHSYDLTVVATDMGGSGFGLTARTKAVIEVLDKNDNAPQFEEDIELFATPDTNSVGDKLGQIRAFDRDLTSPNKDIIYLLKSGGYGKFSLNYDTGEIFLIDDLERPPLMNEYMLEIEALDGGSPRRSTTRLVRVQAPYNAPPKILMNSTVLRVQENRPAHTKVGKVMAEDDDLDEDEGQLQFFIMTDSIPFSVDPHGEVMTNQMLDREGQGEYEFDVYVSDVGTPSRTSSAKVTVKVDDENDNPPRFSQPTYEGVIDEDNRNPRPGQIVVLKTNISVYDEDVSYENQDIRFTLRGPDKPLFSINTRTAELRVGEIASGQIDREQREFFTLTLVATDRGGYGMSSEADLIIRITDTNDEAPRFRPRRQELSIELGRVEIGHSIGKVNVHDADATDPNNRVIYTIENDALGKFSIEPFTGHIIPLRGLFYKPRQSQYTLEIGAMDMGFPSHKTTESITIHVHQANFNDYKPEFFGRTIFSVNEEVPVGSLVGRLSIIDNDISDGEGITLSIHSDSPVPFEIDSSSGEIRTTKRVDADTGVRVYTFEVRARDHGEPPYESVVYVGILIDDINDSAPTFTQKVYRHSVTDVFPPRTIVATPFAYDDVDSANSVYRYSLVGEGAGVYLTIEPETGIVRTTSRLSQLNKQQITFDIIAEDLYNDRLKARAKLVVDFYRSSGGKPCCCKVPC